MGLGGAGGDDGGAPGGVQVGNLNRQRRGEGGGGGDVAAESGD